MGSLGSSLRPAPVAMPSHVSLEVSAIRGQIVLLEALLEDAAATLACLRREAGSHRTPVHAEKLGGDAVEILDHASRSIALQRAAIVERLVPAALAGPRRTPGPSGDP